MRYLLDLQDLSTSDTTAPEFDGLDTMAASTTSQHCSGGCCSSMSLITCG
ncbi:hypothetical protein ACFFSW_35120 [Saccharothrix longispora]|uniref:FxLD family lantipeptide n=1 Tax=Saccharothrix longispora TaxID=33920 RepID=A0ABU1PRX7_9PSEU|nr:hypothetical protein [Saccharothrix longispora]MDR6593402.1 hypothetical protein [Saccharothrix longispora]